MRPLFLLVALTSATLAAAPEPDARSAVLRALPTLSKSAATFVEARGCFSCHHNALPIMMLHMAQERGFAIDAEALRAVETKTFLPLRDEKGLDNAIQATFLNDPTPDESMLLMAAGAAGLPHDLTMEVVARRLARWQRDGHWVTSDFRPPSSSSPVTASATAVRAIALYMPPELRAERDAVLARARTWLLATKPQSAEDSVFQVMGLVWAGIPTADLASATRALLAMQTADGGWAELSGYPSDAYSTGQALYALLLAGMKPADPAWRRGEKFLLNTQEADGSWHVATRMISPADVSPRYFTTGFPYEHDEYLSYEGSAWAVMALLAQSPGKTRPDAAAAPATTDAHWLRTALFGTTEQLKSLLDGGLNPNSATPGETTLLMAAAHDPEKVKLLLARGAKASFEALTVATAYRDAAGSIDALLAAGVTADPPEGMRVKHTPLVFACSTGDLPTVQLLLSHKADPSSAGSSNTPIATAIMFGYPDIVRALIKAGANTGITERTGINLMHWATITGHAEVVPVLAEAGVPVNAADKEGFTPLMYAATIDFGNTSVLNALLKAGATRTLKNEDGRTPLEQARFYHHAQLAAALQ